MPTNYPAAFEGLLRPLLAGQKTISVDKLFASPALGTVTKATKLKHLKAVISDKPKYVGTVEGVLPTDALFVSLADWSVGQFDYLGFVPLEIQTEGTTCR